MYSIGEFSKITGLSIKALRLYHEKGILEPSIIDDESGYRYYKEAEIEKARTITFLKSLMFSLSEISEVLEGFGDEADLLNVLDKKRSSIQQKVQDLQLASRSIDDIIKKEKKAKSVLGNQNFEIEERDGETYLIGAIRWKGKYDESGEYFGRLMKKVGRYACGKPFNLYYNDGYIEEDADIESCVPIRKGKKSDSVDIRHLDEMRFVSLIHKGPYSELGRSYARVFDYIRKNKFTATLPYREVYLKGPGMILKGNENNYLTEIQVVITDS